MIKTTGKNGTFYNKTVTDSGIRIVTETIDYIRSVSIGVWVNVGSRDENELNNGVSHFIEHMVFKGTRKRNSKTIAQSLESVGGYLNAFTSKEHTCYYARILDEHTEKAVDVLSDLVINPVFVQKEIDKEKLVILEELKNYEDEPDELIHDVFESALFSPHPIGNPIIGKRETISNFSKSAALDYKNKHYIGPNIVIAAAGKVDHNKLVDLVNKYFKGVSGSKNGYRRVIPKKSPGKIKEITKPIQQAHLCIGSYAYNVKDKKRYPLLILNTILGDGMSSRLYQNIREKHGLAYSVYSFANLMSDIGFFGIYLGTDKEKLEVSYNLVVRELEKLKEKEISLKELKRTKSQVKGGMVLSLENMSNRMMRLGKSELYYGEHFTLDSIIEQVDKVNPDDVIKVAHEILNIDAFSKITFIPK